MTAGDAADWAAFLDDLEAEVRSVGRAPGNRAAGTFLPPAHLGPLPAELAGRVRQVIATIAEASLAVRAELARTRDQLGELQRHDPRGPKPASTFDARA